MMRIGSGYGPIQTQDVVLQKNIAGRVSAPAAHRRDSLAVDSFTAEARAADMDVRQTQNTITLFRVAEGALSSVEDSLLRLGYLAGGIESGEMSSSEINTSVTEAMVIASKLESATQSATLSGVPVFGRRGDTEAMWRVAQGNAVALDTVGAGDDLTAVAKFDVASLGVRGSRITDAGASERFAAAAREVASVRSVMTAQVSRMGDALMDLTSAALGSISAASASGPAASGGLMAFVRENMDFLVDA